ncbi:MAG: AAA family ATPase [Phycisphaerales bacterium]|nr:AAA family ATPase [Phycisphaerales bacterium]
MFIEKIEIKNFKSFKDIKINLNQELNIFTGVNNSGKTTLLEAIALWHECFTKLLSKAKRKGNNFQKGDWILGVASNKLYPFGDLVNVRIPFFEDLFYQGNRKQKIVLSATFKNRDGVKLEIAFIIGSSNSSTYSIELQHAKRFPYQQFNHFFNNNPQQLKIFYTSPIDAIEDQEDFATPSYIKIRIEKRRSYEVLRNRIFSLFSSTETTRIQFNLDLNSILGTNNSKKLDLSCPKTSTKKNNRVVVNYVSGNDKRPKDIALLGSGTLQIINILLSLYESEEDNQLNLILLDEPDSHLHRDIQDRLIFKLMSFANKRQLFISTHNESFIRKSAHQNLFHLSGTDTQELSPISQHNLDMPHTKKGIYPDLINPIIRDLGSNSGLDMINAVECDRLIFVEGNSDAQVLKLLLNKNLNNKHTKYMFWVMGGINSILEDIRHYKKVFEQIKNNRTLWTKSALVFDRDTLNDHHLELIKKKIKDVLNLPAYTYPSYTMESSIFTNQNKLACLLTAWIMSTSTIEGLHEGDVLATVADELIEAINKYKQTIQQRYDDKKYENIVQLYKNYREKTNKLFNKQELINENDVQLATLVRVNIRSIIASGHLYKIMTKEDVQNIISQVAKKYDLNFNLELNFIDIIKTAISQDSFWFDEAWGFVKDL